MTSLQNMYNIINDKEIIPLESFSSTPTSNVTSIEFGDGGDLIIAVTRYGGVVEADAGRGNDVQDVIGTPDYTSGVLTVKWSIASLFTGDWEEVAPSLLRLNASYPVDQNADDNVLISNDTTGKWTMNVAEINNCTALTFAELDADVGGGGEHALILSTAEQLNLPAIKAAIASTPDNGMPSISEAFNGPQTVGGYTEVMTAAGAKHFGAALTYKTMRDEAYNRQSVYISGKPLHPVGFGRPWKNGPVNLPLADDNDVFVDAKNLASGEIASDLAASPNKFNEVNKLALRALPILPNKLYNALDGAGVDAYTEFVPPTGSINPESSGNDDYLQVYSGSTGPIMSVSFEPIDPNSIGNLGAAGTGGFYPKAANDQWNVEYNQKNDMFQNISDISALRIDSVQPTIRNPYVDGGPARYLATTGVTLGGDVVSPYIGTAEYPFADQCDDRESAHAGDGVGNVLWSGADVSFQMNVELSSNIPYSNSHAPVRGTAAAGGGTVEWFNGDKTANGETTGRFDADGHEMDGNWYQGNFYKFHYDKDATSMDVAKNGILANETGVQWKITSVKGWGNGGDHGHTILRGSIDLSTTGKTRFVVKVSDDSLPEYLGFPIDLERWGITSNDTVHTELKAYVFDGAIGAMTTTSVLTAELLTSKYGDNSDDRPQAAGHIHMTYEAPLFSDYGIKRYSFPGVGTTAIKTYVDPSNNGYTLPYDRHASAVVPPNGGTAPNYADIYVTHIGFFDGMSPELQKVYPVSDINDWQNLVTLNSKIIVCEFGDVVGDSLNGFTAPSGHIVFKSDEVYNNNNGSFSLKDDNDAVFPFDFQSDTLQLGDGSAEYAIDAPMPETYLDSNTTYVNFKATLGSSASIMKILKINDCKIDDSYAIEVICKFALAEDGGVASDEQGLDKVFNLRQNYYLLGSLNATNFYEITNNNIPADASSAPGIGGGGVLGSLFLNDYSDRIKVHYGTQEFTLLNISEISGGDSLSLLKNKDDAIVAGQDRYGVELSVTNDYPKKGDELILHVKLLDSSDALTGDALQHITFTNNYKPQTVRVGAMIGLMEDSWGRDDWPLPTSLKLAYPDDMKTRINFTTVFNSLNTSLNSMVGKMKTALATSLNSKMVAHSGAGGVITLHDTAVDAKVKLIDDDRHLTDTRSYSTGQQLDIILQSKAGTDYQGNFKIDTVDAGGKTVDAGIVSETEVMTGGAGDSQRSAFDANQNATLGDVAARTSAVVALDKQTLVTDYNDTEDTIQGTTLGGQFSAQSSAMNTHNGDDASNIGELKTAIQEAQSYIKSLDDLKNHLRAIFNDLA